MHELLVKNEEFKDSPLGKIPKDWQVAKLSNFYAIPARNGLYKSATYYGRGVLMIHMPQMFRGLEIDTSDAARVDVKTTELERFELKPGDLVFARRSLNLEGAGRCSLVPELAEAVTFESSIIRVRLSTEQLRPTFANYFLNSEIGIRLRLPLIRQVAVSGVSSEDIASIPIAVPPIPEQEHIIEIINTIEETIARTSSLITKLKQTKAGLMQDLLTRGLDEDGKLRDPQAHPEQFKDSPLGRIPKDWGIYQTGTIASIKYGINDAVDQSLESGILTITLPCVTKTGELLLDKESLAFSARHKVSRNDILQPGDLLFNWRNGSQEHLGKTAYFDSQDEYTHVGFLLRIRTNPEICDSRFFWWRISYMKSQGFFLQAKSQVNNTFNSEELANMFVVIPPLNEQKTIVNTIEPCEQRIRTEKAYINKLKLQKQGLMQDLLTGKVRVKTIK
ncbi:MAG: restriction endonuclease subunit S [Nostoc sp. DcaGUA01]|nr:restriction endonuclease subunit S [Nostoc sp. DcaGUA01]